MRCLLPLLTLALAGCGQLIGEAFPKERLILEAAGKRYAVSVQYDPLEFAYFTQTSAADIGPGLTEADRDAVLQLVLNQVGPTRCAGDPMELNKIIAAHIPRKKNVLFLPDRGVYQIVTRCSGDVLNSLG